MCVCVYLSHSYLPQKKPQTKNEEKKIAVAWRCLIWYLYHTLIYRKKNHIKKEQKNTYLYTHLVTKRFRQQWQGPYMSDVSRYESCLSI